MAKRETNAQRVQRIQRTISEIERLFCSAPNIQSCQRAVSEIKTNLKRCAPTIHNEMDVQRATRKIERDVNTMQRALRSYIHASLFTSADSFAEIIKTRRVNKSELTPRDITVFQRAFRGFQDNFPEFLHMVADMLEGKPLRWRANHYGYASEIETAYFKAWDCTGGMPTFSAFKKVFREQNPKLRGDSDCSLDRSLRGAPDRSLRRSLERLGCQTRPDKRGRPKEK
jgi:hypothetical protein